MTTPANGINAWIFLNEDEPPQTNYNSPTSCYQSLIQYKVYNSISFLGIAFFEVVPASSGNGSTIQIGTVTPPHPGGLTNQDYLNYILRDAPLVNPDIKFLATMVYSGSNTLTAVFSGPGTPQSQATAFANNLVVYLRANGMSGMDVDWEGDVTSMTQDQFQVLFSTIRDVFDAQPEKYYLTMAPAWSWSTYDFPTLKNAFDFVSPQFYDGTPLDDFLQAGMSPTNIGYGAQFEPGNSAPNASAQQVWNALSSGFTWQNQSYNYLDAFTWRFNSGNFQFEQAQIMILAQLANPVASDTFDDTAIVGAAGNPLITQMIIQSGDVLNAIQAVNTGTGSYNFGTQPPGTKTGIFTLPQHGGTSGTSQTINIPTNDPIVSISGYTGTWYGWNCVLQLTLTGKSGKTYGPYGTMNGSTSQQPFIQTGQSGQTVLAFKGSTVTVPLAGGGQTAIIAGLGAVFG